MASILAHVREGLGAAELAALSRSALDRPLLHPAELLVAVPVDEALVIGAHQRASELPAGDPRLPLRRRGSGGAEARVGTGTLWLQLSLAQSSALVACPPERLLNRYVRPLLRAITRAGVMAHYFERDWVSGAKRPVASIAYAHDATSGRACVEVIVAVATPFTIRARATTMGKEPATLAELGGNGDPRALARAVIAAYEEAYGAASGAAPVASALDGAAVLDEPAWSAVVAEAIGLVGAGRDGAGRLRVGGELMVSRDALARLEAGLAQEPMDAAALGALVDATLGAPGVALFGVRSLGSIRDVILRAQ
ncbi:MAG TPA: hypothetical protein VLT33_14595 [Labilithrix sp.]|nr:hypothetical protein [Labilithrix sp.]